MAAPKLPSLAAVQSFQTMDQLHFLATGERMPPVAGDACPHPPEYYIKKTHERQQRSRAYAMLVDAARASRCIIPVKPGEVNGVSFNRALSLRGSIVLFHGEQPVMTLWPDGRDHVEPTPPPSEASSPRSRFRLRSPPMRAAGTDAPLSRCVSPIVVAGSAAAQVSVEIQSRLRPNFRRLLADLSSEGLSLELEEWEEELQRAQEHVDAIREEIMSRACECTEEV